MSDDGKFFQEYDLSNNLINIGNSDINGIDSVINDIINAIDTLGFSISNIGNPSISNVSFSNISTTSTFTFTPIASGQLDFNFPGYIGLYNNFNIKHYCLSSSNNISNFGSNSVSPSGDTNLNISEYHIVQNLPFSL